MDSLHPAIAQSDAAAPAGFGAPRHLGVAVAGLGVGEQHALAYVRDPRCRVRWLYDLDAVRLREVAARVGQGDPAASYEAMLGADVDLVSIASFDAAHHEQVVAALARGKHVFVEKPLCCSLDELAAIKRAWSAAGRPALDSNLVLRAAPLYRWLRALIAAGELGTIYAIDGEYLYGRLSKITEGWRKDEPDYSVLLGGAIHMIDLMLWLTGERPERVSTVGNRISTAGTAFRYDDFAAATFTFPSGLIGRITANFGCVHRHHHVLRVYGTRATFLYDDAGARLHRTRDPEVLASPVSAAPLPASKGDLIPEFVSLIAAGADTVPLAQRNFDLISVAAAAETALRERSECRIRYA